MIDEKILEKLKLVRAANPEMSYDDAWNVVTAKKALPNDLGAAARALQASCPGMSFEEAFDLIEAEALPHLRKGETVGMALIRARQQKPEPTFDFDQWLADAEKRLTERSQHVEAIDDEPWPKGRMMLIRGSIGTYVEAA